MENIKYANLSSHERILAILSHASIFLGYVMPLGHIVGPLLFYILINRGHGFAKQHAKNALAFSITMTAIYIIGLLAMVLAAFIFNLPYLLFLSIGLVSLKLFAGIAVVIAMIKTSNGKLENYPLSLRF